MAQTLTLFTASVLVASGSEATGHSVVGSTVNIEIETSAVSGTTPSATFSVQWSDDGVQYGAVAADTFTAQTVAGNLIQQFTAKGQYFKLAWTITGTTPSFTTTALAYT